MNQEEYVGIPVPISLEASVRELLAAHTPKPEPCQACNKREEERAKFPYEIKSLIMQAVLDHSYSDIKPLELTISLHESAQFLINHSVKWPETQCDDGPI